MNDNELDRFEAELRRMPPARPPEQFMARLKAASPCVEPAQTQRRPSAAKSPGWSPMWRWLSPAFAVAVAGLLLVRASLSTSHDAKRAPLAVTYGAKGDDIQVDQELVSSFDVVATLPGGQPVRFHCQKWNDQVVVTDTNRGVEIVQSSPRVEVVPVRFETY